MLEASKYGDNRSGELRKGVRNFRDVFTPCAGRGSLLKNIHLAAENALAGDVILFSPASSSFDQFRKNPGMEEVSRRAAKALAPTIGGGNTDIHPNMQSVFKKRQNELCGIKINLQFAPGFFEEKPRRKNHNPKPPHNERTLTRANNQ